MSFADSTAPAVTDDGIVIGYNASIAKYDRVSGAMSWSDNGTADAKDVVINGSSAYLSARYFGLGTDESFDVATGTSGPAFVGTLAPAFDGPLGFFVYGDQVSAVDMASGQTRWTALGPVGDDFLLPPLIAAGTLYLVDDYGNLIALDETTGAMVWSDPGVDPPGTAPPGNPILGPQPLAASGAILLVPEATTLVAYTSAMDAGIARDAAAAEGPYDAGTPTCEGGQPLRVCVEYNVLFNWLASPGAPSDIAVACQAAAIPQTPAEFASIEALCEVNLQRILPDACEGCTPGSCGPCP
jgi:hypothetical protein